MLHVRSLATSIGLFVVAVTLFVVLPGFEHKGTICGVVAAAAVFMCFRPRSRVMTTTD